MTAERLANLPPRSVKLAPSSIKLQNPVHLLLAALAVLAAVTLPLLTFAPNRLLSGHGIYLGELFSRPGPNWLLAIPALPLLAAPWLRANRISRILLVISVALFSAGLLAVAGQEAQLRSGGADSLARVSFGGAFWVLALTAWLQLTEALRGLSLPVPARVAVVMTAALPAAGLLLTGQSDSLSLLKEYHNHLDTFDLALLRHLQLVFFSVLPAILIGTTLGVLSFRSRRLHKLLFPVLNVIQTIPSIAMFGLLIGPLTLLGVLLPGSGISGIGMSPALLALVLYSLLPMTRSALAGLEQVPASVREAARGIGMSPSQLFFKVELPLALPVFLNGVRVTTVQAVGLVEVAALIGAGGFGTLMFQGMASSALDLVLLGVIPVVLLAIAVDTAFKVVISLLVRKIDD
ncbi:Osmoprotectant ABC transporter permease protein YehY [Collimonas arenae]|uniref:Osmoprotectant ABC transporter permease protein YehY n=1 Tax=Collimonas arenae TaxID=279058 RepID=A0A0A1FFJ4_9BURK|nr:ABC transporter permease [Collimonas arenae]AIY41622.1 Osmoprotectant ABC transporter permease protein YehY [Collimonas arenae]